MHILNLLKRSDDVVQRLFFKLLPVQVMIVAMGSINSIVDGVIAGQFIDAKTVGVIGLFFSMVNILTAIGAVLLGGTSVLIGRYMGEGNTHKTKGIFSLNITVTLIIGALITFICLFLSQPVATLLGAKDDLLEPLMLYMRGFAIGIIPMLMAQQIASFLQLERQSTRSYLGIVMMIVSNIIADITFVVVLKLGVFGLALATTTSNTIYFVILGQYYFTKKAQLKYNYQSIEWKELFEMIKIGIPGAMLVFCLGFRNIVINRILLKYEGPDGLSALSAFNMISGLLIAYCLGASAVIRMLAAVFIGEEDRSSIKKLFQIVYTRGLALTILLAIFFVLISGFIASIFFPDTSSHVYALTKMLIIIMACCLPVVLSCCVNSNYLQALGHHLFVNILSIFDGFFAMVIPAVILTPLIGALGVWLANPIGIFLTWLLTPLYCIFYWKRMPKNIDEWLFLPKDFGVPKEDRIDVSIDSMDEVVGTSEAIQDFCLAHKMDPKIATYSALCFEEIASNIVEHGFTKDKKSHTIDGHVVYKDNSILLRIKDDCVPFNPEERAKLVNPDNPVDNLGIRIVQKLADEVTYQNLIGLNVLSIKLK